jgi:putative chitinase
MDLTKLFNALRSLSGSLSQIQVDSCNAILEAGNKHAITDVHQIAYILATAWHESRLKPIEEIGKGAGHAYGKLVNSHAYYGRGFVQVTWKYNYATFGKLLNIDLVNHPELALQPDYAAEIIVLGMKNGLFTGKRLSNYFTATSQDPINARRIVNGLDCSELIAGYYKHILSELV